MIKEQTNQTITTTQQDLRHINRELTKYLKRLLEQNTRLTQSDRKIIREIRDKNLETIQLIDRMNYTQEVEL